MFTPPQLNALTAAVAKWAKNSTEDESAMVFIACAPPDFNVRLLALRSRILIPDTDWAPQPTLVVLPFFNGSVEEGKKRFKDLYDVGPVADLTREMPYAEVNTLQVRRASRVLLA